MAPTADRKKPRDWHAEPGVFWVYVIRSEASGKLYIGHTNDLAGRVRQHNDPARNRSLYTKRQAGPWTLVHSERCPTRAAAMGRERYLKSGRGRAWLRACFEQGASPPEAD